ncbi:DNA primase [Rudanella paleaurantiibacter]|uniref:DNA primase n=1 Tax=Rudanella paleaurantiibacter TaxID=2614655 RepID=A0A7J5U0B4_9BACT|nr:phage/plasmid primase, P4 family [Rudanella paleaurantiibacter]KAB7731085.1 DNA primase [Rudanella paleaurantiibacter]
MTDNVSNLRSSSQKIKQAVAGDAKHLKATAFVCLSHAQMIKNLLDQIGKIDFRERAGFAPDDEEAKLKKAHYLVIAVEEVLSLAERNKWGLCRRDGFFYSFNGAYWKPLDKDDLKNFLKQAAERMGVDRFQARHFEYAEQLFKQFNETAYLPSPEADRFTVMVNLSNGTFAIGTDKQELRTPSAADFLTHQLPFGYDPKATAPKFQAYLNRVLPDIDCQHILAEYLGYVFINPAKLKLEKTLLLYGTGANGKSVFFEIVTALLGNDNVSHYSLQSLTNEPAYCRAHLATKLVNYASEINGKLEADTFKQLVSGEPVEARLPYGQPFILTNYAKLIFNCNELPADVEHTPAYFRRFLIVPFKQTIPEQDQDKQLARKIIDTELSGVFNWVLTGLRRLLEQGRFTDSEAVREQLESYKKQSDTVRLFLDDNSYQSSDSFTPLKDLYRDYRAYCIEDGYKAVNNRNFQKRLNANGVTTERKTIGYVAYVRRPDLP